MSRQSSIPVSARESRGETKFWRWDNLVPMTDELTSRELIDALRPELDALVGVIKGLAADPGDGSPVAVDWRAVYERNLERFDRLRDGAV